MYVRSVMTDEHLADLSAVDLVAAYAAKSLSPVEVVEAVTERIGQAEPVLNALYAYDPERARKTAASSERRWLDGAPCGPLDGVPITLKENIATAGEAVPLGTAATSLTPAAEDAPAAARVREAGAVLLAKTTMPDWGMLSSGVSSFHPRTRNAWNPEWNPGGSSAGAGAAAAAGYGPLHLGTDIGGSVRLPAAWNGVVGLKPSFGRVPVAPAYYARVVGPLTRTVADTALLMSVVSAADRRDPMSLPPEALPWADLDGIDPRDLRVGVLREAGCGMPVECDVARCLDRAAALFRDSGAVVADVDPFMTPDLVTRLDLFWRARVLADFERLDREKQEVVTPFVAAWCRGAAGASGTDVVRGVNAMLEISQATLAATEELDLLLSPVAPVATFPEHWPTPSNDVDQPMAHIGFTLPFSMSGQPAVSVPCGFTEEGRPLAVQISGRRFDDLGVLRAARWFEASRPERDTRSWPRVWE
jgi:aspartyl-tRNA(Asn)/glutamyl-tRNA(Gln) amidotransferase subunit A